MSTLTTRKPTLLDRARTRMEQRAARQKLIRDLDRYRTPRQRAELDAMMDRGNPAQVAPLRQIVDAQRRPVV